MATQVNLNVEMFLEQLAAATPKSRSDEPRNSVLNYINLSIPDNFGKYQVFPMISEVTGLPFTYLTKTREINLPRLGTDQYKWYKLLPLNAYQFMDSTGRLVSSLTDGEADLLNKAYGLFDSLNASLPDTFNDKKKKDIVRVKDYTIFNAYVINKYSSDVNKPERSNFAALFICSSKRFSGEINMDIQMQSTNYGGTGFVSDIYNRKLTGRTGWLIFSIGKATQGFGYSVGVSHAANLAPNVTGGYSISEEQANAMKDPVRNFLAWQSGPEGKSTFNREVIEYIINQMTQMYSKINSASVSYSTNSVSQAQVNTAVGAVQQRNPQQYVDPIVAQYNAQHSNVAPQQTMVQTPSQVAANNTNVYSVPPAAQIDPVTGAPSNMGTPQQSSFGYNAPSFANPSAGQGQPNPFLNAPANPFSK